jgi:hypothetical protein
MRLRASLRHRTQTQIDRTLLWRFTSRRTRRQPQSANKRRHVPTTMAATRLSFELCELDQEFSSAILGDMLHIAARRRRQKIFIDERLHGSRILYFITVMPDGVLDHASVTSACSVICNSFTSAWDGAPKSSLLFGAGPRVVRHITTPPPWRTESRQLPISRRTTLQPFQKRIIPKRRSLRGLNSAQSRRRRR